MSGPIVEVKELRMGWGDTVLLQDATFSVEQGEIFAILGGSGCGKSTLLRHVIGLEAPMAGEIAIFGSPHPTLETGRPPFGVAFQSGALFGSMTVGDNLALSLEEWTSLPPSAVSAIVRAKLRLVGLDGTEDKLPSELSGGMRKRAAIARAMVLEPELLFLDEPTAGLDPLSAVELDTLIKSLSEAHGITVVLVTHDLPSVFGIVTRCILLDRESKSILARGDPRELRDHESDPRVHRFLHREAGVAS